MNLTDSFFSLFSLLMCFTVIHTALRFRAYIYYFFYMIAVVNSCTEPVDLWSACLVIHTRTWSAICRNGTWLSSLTWYKSICSLKVGVTLPTWSLCTFFFLPLIHGQMPLWTTFAFHESIWLYYFQLTSSIFTWYGIKLTHQFCLLFSLYAPRGFRMLYTGSTQWPVCCQRLAKSFSFVLSWFVSQCLMASQGHRIRSMPPVEPCLGRLRKKVTLLPEYWSL